LSADRRRRTIAMQHRRSATACHDGVGRNGTIPFASQAPIACCYLQRSRHFT